MLLPKLHRCNNCYFQRLGYGVSCVSEQSARLYVGSSKRRLLWNVRMFPTQLQLDITANGVAHALACRCVECGQNEGDPCCWTQRSTLESSVENTTMDIMIPTCPATGLACQGQALNTPWNWYMDSRFLAVAEATTWLCRVPGIRRSHVQGR